MCLKDETEGGSSSTSIVQFELLRRSRKTLRFSLPGDSLRRAYFLRLHKKVLFENRAINTQQINYLADKFGRSRCQVMHSSS
jgi:hypothetical protein